MKSEQGVKTRLEESPADCLIEIEELEPITAPGLTWSV
jgi:hypothetical protein